MIDFLFFLGESMDLSNITPEYYGQKLMVIKELLKSHKFSYDNAKMRFRVEQRAYLEAGGRLNKFNRPIRSAGALLNRRFAVSWKIVQYEYSQLQKLQLSFDYISQLIQNACSSMEKP